MSAAGFFALYKDTVILVRVGNLPLEVDGGRYILKRSTETTVSRGIRGLPINRINAEPLMHMFLLTCSIMRCIIQTRKHSKIAIRGAGKMAKTKAVSATKEPHGL